MTSHEDWEELAAAHALGSLEPEDEQRLESHLLTCAECARVQADTRAVMADLAATTEQVAPPPELKTRLMAVIHQEAADEQPRAAAVASGDPLAARRARKRSTADTWTRFAVAASVILLAVIAAGVWSLNRGSTAQHPQWVSLESTSQQQVATVELLGDHAYVVPRDLPANDTSNSQYVLWAVPHQGAPVAVGTFDVTNGQAPVEVGQVSPDPSTLKGFAVSKEPGRTVPAAPTVVVAQGALA